MRVFVKLQLENGDENDACTSSCEFRTRPLGLCSRRSDAKPLLQSAPAALVASPAADRIQVGSSDVQTSEHVEPGLPSRPNHGTCLKPNFMLICHPAADPTVHRGQTFLSVLKSRLKTFHSLRLSVNTAPTCLQTPKPLKLRPYDTCRINSIITLHLRRSVL